MKTTSLHCEAACRTAKRQHAQYNNNQNLRQYLVHIMISIKYRYIDQTHFSAIVVTACGDDMQGTKYSF